MRKSTSNLLGVAAAAALSGAILSVPTAAVAQAPGQPVFNPFAWLFPAAVPQCVPSNARVPVNFTCTLQTVRGRNVCHCEPPDTDAKGASPSFSTGSISAPAVSTPSVSALSVSPPSPPTSSGGNTPAPPEPTVTADTGKQKGNNGKGNGIDPQPPGNPPINDGPGQL
jgi:hypothetical protein